MSRTIKTVYSDRSLVIKVNSSTDPNVAVSNCVRRMQINQYGATVAEVYDNDTGELHAQIRRKISGSISIEYARDPRAYEVRLAHTWAKDNLENPKKRG